MANPLYGQNKFDNSIGGKGELVKNGGIPRQDTNGVAPVGGLIVAPHNSLVGAAASTKGHSDFSGADPYTSGTSQLFPLGSELHLGEKSFRYAGISSAGAVTAGKLVQQQVSVGADHETMAPTANVAAGATEISIETDGTNLSLNNYQDGYLYIEDGTGEGQQWKIKANPAHVHGTDASVIIQIYDSVATALVASGDSKVTIIKNPFADAVIAPTAETGCIIGATVVDMAASEFGWLQYRGPRAMLVSEAVVVLGHRVVRSDADAGGVMAANSDPLLYPVGQVMAGTVADTAYAMIWLNI